MANPLFADGAIVVFNAATKTYAPVLALAYDGVNLAAAVAATTLATPAVSGTYLVSAYSIVTQVATTSSSLGGAVGMTVNYTDADSGVAQSVIMSTNHQSGNVSPINSGNQTTTNMSGSVIVHAKVGVAITFTFGYTSVGATPMQYSLHVKAVLLGI
jgi:hypothetical protein